MDDEEEERSILPAGSSGILLTGIHRMNAGELEANLVHLNAVFGLSYIPDLIAMKIEGCEKERLTNADMDFYREEFAGVFGRL